jgi:hypothetical protein
MSRQSQRRGSKYQKKQAALEKALASFERLTLQEEGLRYEKQYRTIQEQVGPGCVLSDRFTLCFLLFCCSATAANAEWAA